MIGLDVHLQSAKNPSSSFDAMIEAAGLERIANMRDEEVLTPRPGQTLHRGALEKEIPPGACPPQENWVLVEDYAADKCVFVPPARILPWTGYAERIVGKVARPAARVASYMPISIWRCELWTEGFFSCLFFAVGFLEAECGVGQASGLDMAPQRMLIDWSSNLVLFHGGGERDDNAWNHFFEQSSCRRKRYAHSW